MPPRRTWSSSPFMSPLLLIILLSIIAFTFLFFALPSFLSATTHILRPASVHKTWDWNSLNIFLVLFAVLCGVFSRRNDDESSPPDQQEPFATTIVLPPNDNDAYVKITGEGGYVSPQWFGFSESEERMVYDIPPVRLQSPATGVSRLRTSSSSYPDLRQESSWETGTDPCKFRYLDDFEIDMFRSPATDQLPVDHRKRWTEVEQQEEDDVKKIQVETFEIRSSTPKPKSPAPPPPLPPTPTPPPAATVPRKERVDNDSELSELQVSLPPTPPTLPPQPSQPAKVRSEHKHGKSKSNVKRERAMVLASVLSNQKKKKKKKQGTKTSHNHDSEFVLHSSSEFPNNKTALPPPPPPPPASVFHSLFKKGLGKSKKIHSVPPQPQPRPPLTSSKRKSQIPSETPAPAEPLRRKNAGRPPLPTKVSSFYDEAVNTGNRSPLIPVTPPFKLPEMNFVVRGDFVRTRGKNISRCGSPEREDVDVSATTTTKPVMNNGDGGGSVFCPSPDVNVKAATFIARLRGEWQLEKLNSLKGKANFRP